MNNSSLKLVNTADGSTTIYNPEVGEHYHSKHGARQESQHVFVNAGLDYFLRLREDIKSVSILEVGFGTGLNFLLTAQYSLDSQLSVNYVGVEPHPLPIEIISETKYDEFIDPSIWQAFLKAYPSVLRCKETLSADFSLQVFHKRILEFHCFERFDVVYFDAFASVHQPDMWTDEVIGHVSDLIKPEGVFVTYAITGNLKRTLKNLGFKVEKAPGAPGKREMLRAIKF